MDDNWDRLLSEFRRLGGIADNICQKEGKFGRGIFSIDSSVRSRLFTPSNLMIKKNDIYLEDNKIRIKENKEYKQETKNFFNFYQDNFSWGAGGKETTELFEKELSLFNSNLKKLIKKYALVDIDERHSANWDEVVKNQFLQSRAVTFRKDHVIAPVFELVNHKVRTLPFIINEEGISIPNYPASNVEIRHSYNNISPLRRFFLYGFYSEETIVFSVPFSLNIKDLGIQLFCEGRSLKDDSMKIKRFDNKISIEGLPIADVNHPRLPYDYFNEIIKRISDINLSKDLLLRIFELNIESRKSMIKESQLIDNEVSKIFTNVLKYEMNLIQSDN